LGGRLRLSRGERRGCRNGFHGRRRRRVCWRRNEIRRRGMRMRRSCAQEKQ